VVEVRKNLVTVAELANPLRRQRVPIEDVKLEVK